MTKNYFSLKKISIIFTLFLFSLYFPNKLKSHYLADNFNFIYNENNNNCEKFTNKIELQNCLKRLNGDQFQQNNLLQEPGNNYYFIYNEGGKDESSENNVEILMSLNPIFDLYKSNEIAAWDKYNGVVYQVVGKVSKIDSDIGTIFVKLNQNYINCKYNPRDHLNIIKLELNGPVSVKGPLKLSKGRNRNLYLSIDNCRVLGRNQYKTKEDITNEEIYKKDKLEKLNEEKRITDIINSEYF